MLELLSEVIEEARRRGDLEYADARTQADERQSVRVRNGQTLSTDGPFAETHEQLGGFFMLDCKDLDEAMRWAAKIPHAQYGSVEIRPLWDQI
jgi:hypothetical protein